MAAYTSVQSGDFNDVDTWGGGGYPSSAGDTFTVDTGHTVTYNVVSTVEFGASIINGTLAFITNGNTKLTFGQATLTVGATGVLQRGSSGTPVGAAYTSELVWNTTGDNNQGLSITNGGHVYEYGDPTYCTNWESTLANDAENTDGDATIILNDDRSSDWHVGDEITIQRELMGDSTSYTDAVIKRTIQSMSGTSVTLTETVTGMVTEVGSTWVSTVVNVTRNVKMYKYGAVTDIQSASRYNTYRPYLNDATTGTNTNIWSNVQFTGLYRVTAVGAILTNCIIRNGERGFYTSNNNTISGNVYSCNYGFYTSNNNTISGNVYSCNYGFYNSNNNTVSGDVYSCNYGFYGSNNNTVSGNVYSCNYGFGGNSNNNTVSGDVYSCNYGFYGNSNNTVSGNVYSCNYGFNTVSNNTVSGNVYSCGHGFGGSSNNNTVSGKLGYSSADVSSPNTYDLRTSSIICKNAKMPLAGLVFYDRNTIGGLSEATSEHDNRVLNAHKIYRNMGDVIKTACDGSGTSPSVDPDAGNGYCVEVSNLQSNISAMDCMKLFNDYQYAIWAAASTEKTYTFKIQSIFTATLANTEIILQAKYLNGSDGALTGITSTETVEARSDATDWSQELSVTITPSQDGFVYFQVCLTKYESGKKIYLWPKVIIE